MVGPTEQGINSLKSTSVLVKPLHCETNDAASNMDVNPSRRIMLSKNSGRGPRGAPLLQSLA